MALPVTISGISTAVACVGPFKSSNAPFLVVNNSDTSSGVNLGNVDATTNIAQTFLSGTGQTLGAVVVQLNKILAPTDNVVCELWSTASGAPSTLLATAITEIAGTSLSTSAFTVCKFTFDSFALSDNTTYAIVLSRSGSNNASNYYTLETSTTTVYSGGNVYTGTAALSWSSLSNPDMWLVLCSPDPAYYFFGRDSSTATTLQAFKATDPTSSWASIANVVANTIGAISGVQVGDLIHLATSEEVSVTSTTIRYRTFNMAADSFVLNETVHSGFDNRTSTAVQQFACSICVQNSQPTILYNGPQVANMGANYSRIYEKHRTGVNTWAGGATPIDAGGTVNHMFPETIPGISNTAHCLWHDGTFTNQRTISSAYALQTASAAISGVTSQAILFNTDKVLLVCANSVLRFTSANTPTLTSSNLPAGLVSLPNHPFADGTDVWVLGGNFSDSDLYVSKSTDNGANWGAAAIALVGSVAAGTAGRQNLSRDGTIYQRDTSVVIPYIVNDNGTLKYNEYVVRTVYADAWSSGDKSSNVTLSNVDKTATASGATTAVRSTTLNSSSSGKYYAEFVVTNYISGSTPRLGLKLSSTSLTDTTDGVWVNGGGSIVIEGSTITSPFNTFSDSLVVSIAWDAANQKAWFRYGSDPWNNDGGNDPATNTGGTTITSLAAGTYGLWAYFGASAEAVTIRTEAAEFTQTTPTGFKSWMDEDLTVSGALTANRFDNAQTFNQNQLIINQILTQTARFDNSQTFGLNPVVGRGTVNIGQTTRFDNSQTYNTQVLVSLAPNLQPLRFDNAQTYVTHIVGRGTVNINQTALFSNAQTYNTHDVAQQAPGTNLGQTTRFDNAQNFYTPHLSLRLAVGLFTNAQTYYSPKLSLFLSQSARFDNAQTFPSHAISQADLRPALHTNTQTFNTHALKQFTYLTQTARYDNAQTYYTQVVVPAGITMPQTARFDNAQTYPTSVIEQGTTILAVDRFDNSQTFYTHALGRGTVNLAPQLFANAQAFQQSKLTLYLVPSLYTNTQTFYAPKLSQVLTQTARFNNAQSYYQGKIGLFLKPTATPWTNDQTFFFAQLKSIWPTTQTATFVNTQTYYSVSISLRLTANLFTNAQTYPQGLLTVTGANLFVNPFLNTQTYPQGAITTGPVALTQTARFNNAQTFDQHTLLPIYRLIPARFDNTQTFNGHVAYQFYELFQTARLDNEQTFYPINLIFDQHIAMNRIENEVHFPVHTVKFLRRIQMKIRRGRAA